MSGHHTSLTKHGQCNVLLLMQIPCNRCPALNPLRPSIHVFHSGALGDATHKNAESHPSQCSFAEWAARMDVMAMKRRRLKTHCTMVGVSGARV